MDDTSGKDKNYYDLLGVDQKAGQEDIKRAYREKLKEWHPDKNPEAKEEAEEITKTINVAYDILSDPEKRKNYDRMLRFSKGKNLFEYVNDESFFEKIKGASGALKRILEDVRELYFLFKDAARGRYRIQPVNLGIIGGGLLYFIIPSDLIPDVLPLVGLLDDVAILTTIINSLQDELSKYRNWKRDNED
jgi:curved DNA-binding protein CbpA